MRRSWELSTLVLTGGLLSFAPPTIAGAATPDPAGTWEGTARTDEGSLPLTITFVHEAEGWTGTVDVPDQYALDYPLADLRFDESTITFRFPDTLPPAQFDGAIEKGRIQGRLTSSLGPEILQGTFELWRRPSATPPYTAEPVHFRNGDLELAGTIFRPRADGRHPAIVFVHGSGPQTRDSYIRWFAGQFARAGFITLIYDKRGTGESGGEPWPQTAGSFVDLADDAVAGARFLAGQPFVDAGRIGIWGLSQGAWIGPLAAARASSLVSFVIMISGGGVSPAEQELYDDEVKLRDRGFPQAEIEQAISYLRLADQYVRTQRDEDWSRFAQAREEARTKSWYKDLDRFPQILPREAPLWAELGTDLDYDPATTLSKIQKPVLLILGEEDRSTPARETERRVKSILEGASNHRLTVRIYPGADHALLTRPKPTSHWPAERPAEAWVTGMIDWATTLWG